MFDVSFDYRTDVLEREYRKKRKGGDCVVTMKIINDV